MNAEKQTKNEYFRALSIRNFSSPLKSETHIVFITIQRSREEIINGEYLPRVSVDPEKDEQYTAGENSQRREKTQTDIKTERYDS